MTSLVPDAHDSVDEEWHRHRLQQGESNGNKRWANGDGPRSMVTALPDDDSIVFTVDRSNRHEPEPWAAHLYDDAESDLQDSFSPTPELAEDAEPDGAAESDRQDGLLPMSELAEDAELDGVVDSDRQGSLFPMSELAEDAELDVPLELGPGPEHDLDVEIEVGDRFSSESAVEPEPLADHHSEPAIEPEAVQRSVSTGAHTRLDPSGRPAAIRPTPEVVVTGSLPRVPLLIACGVLLAAVTTLSVLIGLLATDRAASPTTESARAEADNSQTAVLAVDDGRRLQVEASGRSQTSGGPARFDPSAVELQSELDRLLANTPLVFAAGQETIGPRHERVLDKTIELLADHPGTAVTVVGYTDDAGTAEENIRVSTARARSVGDYLVSRGVSAADLTVEGLGESTSTGLASIAGLERRVEFEVAPNNS